MKPKTFIILGVIVALIVGIGFAVATKWRGSTAEEAALDVRDEFTGKRVIDQGEDVKRQLRNIAGKQKSQLDSISE